MMGNLTLTSEQLNALSKAFAGLCVVFTAFVILFYLMAGEKISFSIGFRSFSTALVLTTSTFWIFYRWAWRLGPLPRWFGRPLVRGIWVGYLSSNYGRTPQQEPLKKPIVFVVRQTYLTLSIQSFTDNQVGESKVEALLLNPRTELTRLAYVYELANEYSGSRTLVNGAGDLQVLMDDTLLDGNYWTSSPTHGTLQLRRISSDCNGVNGFQDAIRKWPINSQWLVKR